MQLFRQLAALVIAVSVFSALPAMGQQVKSKPHKNPYMGSPFDWNIDDVVMDYLLPSSMEVPKIDIVDHCTPSPLTTFGQKCSGEAGYLGAPAAIAGAVNDALAPLGATIDALPMTPHDIWNRIHEEEA